MPDILVIGYGNPLRGDDGVGSIAAETVEKTCDPKQVRVLICHQLTPDLAEDVGRVRLVIFIDAKEGGEPGSVNVEEINARNLESAAFTHHITPPSLLMLAKELYQSSPKAYFVTVVGERFNHSELLSDTVRESISEITTVVHNLIDG